MTINDVRTNIGAIALELTVGPIGILVYLITALIAKVRAWIAASLIGKLVKESDWDYVYLGVVTEVTQTLLIGALTLKGAGIINCCCKVVMMESSAYPVHGHICVCS